MSVYGENEHDKNYVVFRILGHVIDSKRLRGDSY